MKILVGTNVLANIEPEVYSRHLAEMFVLGRDPEITSVLQFCPKRMTIDRMRNEAAKLAMANDCDWLVFVDDDMLLTPNTIRQLVKTDYDILMAHTFIRGYPFQPMSFVNRPDPGTPINLYPFEDVVEQANPETGIADCYAVGFACCAIRVDLLLNLEPPYFVTGPAHTEDIYFCVRAKQEIGNHVKVGVHTKYPTYHRVDSTFIGENNKEKMREFYKPQEEKIARSDDRGAAYHERIKSITT